MTPDLVWIPWTLITPETAGTNLFISLKHPVPSELTPREPSDKLQLILNHLKNIWCCGDLACYHYLVAWLAHKIQRPQAKIGVAVVAKSDLQGTGKNIIYDFFSDYVIGSQFCRSIDSIEDFFSRFNSQAEFTILTCLDEVGQKGGT